MMPVPQPAGSPVAREEWAEGPVPSRVLFVIPGDPERRSGSASDAPGSSMIFARRQAEQLQRQGLTVDVFFLRSRTAPFILLGEFLRFRRQMNTWKPAVIHAHFGTVTGLFTVLAVRLVALSGARARVPIVITYRGSDLNFVPSARGPRAFLGRIFSQLAALGATRIVCVSQALRHRLWWRRDLVTILPSGVDLTVFHPAPQGKARTRLGWPEDARIVLFNAGHDARNKRLDLAEAAIAVLQQWLPNVQLKVMCGDVAPDRVPDWMNASDCLLLTSDAEGSPTVVQEALACALPIVSVKVGDVAERLGGVQGTSVCARDPIALAKAIQKLLTPPCRSLGPNRAAEVDSMRIARELFNLYRTCIVAEETSGSENR
jgi:teichuronic acid biosynthesis glycosyltransferase TuaC